MASLFHITIMSTDRKIFEGDVQSLVAPGEMGYFGVLANHAPFLASLAPGSITLNEPSGNIRTFGSRSAGFFEINNNRAVMLLDTDVDRDLY